MKINDHIFRRGIAYPMCLGSIFQGFASRLYALFLAYLLIDIVRW